MLFAKTLFADPGSADFPCPEDFSAEQREIAFLTREFADNEIKTQKDNIEKLDAGLSRGILKKAGEIGLLGADVPEVYGGSALDKTTSALIAENIARGQSASFLVTFSAHTGIGTLPIVYFGTEEQKRNYLPKLISGENLSAYALTEPGSGSDALAAKTRADFDQGKNVYLLNGTKQFITNGAWADLVILYAKVNGDRFTAFLLEPPLPGYSYGSEEKKIGIKGSSTASLILENVSIPAGNLLGVEGEGHKIAFNVLNIGRIKLGAANLGASKEVLTESFRYAEQRKQFGSNLLGFGMIQKKIAEIFFRIFAMETILYRTTGLLDQEAGLDEHPIESIEKYAVQASIVKVFNSEMHGLNTDDGLQIFGGYGYSEEYPLAAMYRDTRIDRIFEGTNEINRQIIAGRTIKELNQVNFGYSPNDLKIESDRVFERAAGLIKVSQFVLSELARRAGAQFGKGLSAQQMWLEDFSNLVIELYVLESVYGRVQKRISRKIHPTELNEALLALSYWRLLTWLKANLWKLYSGLNYTEVSGDILTWIEAIFQMKPKPDYYKSITTIFSYLRDHGNYGQS